MASEPSQTPQQSQPNSEDCFKILLATDIHLGYKEKDVIIGNDSFIAFEEILWHARDQQVDFILLGGDLFHDTNPSKEALHKCLELLRHFTLGDAPIGFEILSNHQVNYDDPNMNIAIPVFSIHGNHDDPSGYGGLSSMDVLSTSGLLNYFGRCDDLTEVKISPILMKKGITQLAMYGLSHIHDNRLARLFRDSKVIMEQPDERSGEWFNVMVLHQNRVDRGPKNYIPEEVLPDFLDFVLWGHEHDCRVTPEEVAGKSFFVTQPGSSVATSLSEGESIQKHIAVLSVYKSQFRLEPIKLQTVRPFVFKSINLQDYEDELDLNEGDVKPKIKELVSGIINSMIEEAKQKRTDAQAQPKLPLIRLRVTYQNEDHAFNEIRFGQQYNGMVANPSDIVKMQRNIKRVKSEKKSIDNEAMNNAFERDEEDQDDIRLEDYVDRYFKDPNNAEKLQVLFPPVLSDVCRRLAENQDEDTANKMIELSIKRACDFLNDKMPEDVDIEDVLVDFQTTGEQVFKDIQNTISTRKASSIGSVQLKMDEDDGEDDSTKPNSKSKKPRAPRATANKSTASKATTSKATPKKATAQNQTRATARGNSRDVAGPSTTATASATRSRQQQPTILQTMRRSTRPSNAMVYEIDSD